jgi:hypothetical protein
VDIPELQDHIAILPTMVIQPHDNMFHNAEAEENPHLPQALASNTPATSQPDAPTMANPLPQIDFSPMAIGSIEPAIQSDAVEQLPFPTQEKHIEHSYNHKQLHLGQFSHHATVPRRFRISDYHPQWMILIASLLIVFIIGSLATYQYFKVAPGGHKNPEIKPGRTPVVKQHLAGTPTTTPQALQNVQQLPTPPLAVPHGALIYGTTSPSCDTQGDEWSTPPDVGLNCTTDGTQITTNQNITDTSTGTFLEQLPNGTAMPNDFVVQAQVTINPGSQGSFGIYFRSQPDDHQNSYLFLIDQDAANWTIYYKDPNTHTFSALNIPPVPTMLHNATPGTITIDLQIQGNDYGIFINGTNTGNAQTYTSWYGSGTIGLAVGQGANVTFKNVAIYALP